jgi:lysophospholipase L1-like esterase
MMDWVRAHPRLAAGAALAVLVIGFMLVRSRDNAWRITNERSQGAAIVAFGDSLTEGYRMSPGEGYPEQLAKLVGRPIVNRGVSGNTTADGLARLEADVLTESPRVVLLGLGANDMLRQQPIDETFGNLRRIVDRIHARGAMVVLIGVEGFPLVHGDYGARYRSLARETGCVYVADMLDGVLGDPALMYDQIHPNAAGYARIARRIDSEVGDYLRR